MTELNHPAENGEAVLTFWFGLKSPGKKDDARVREVLGPLHERAAVGELIHWAEPPRDRLALILLLDQVPRHLYRDDPRAYATDAMARDLTALFVERNDWRTFKPIEKFYASHPWLHAEDFELQSKIHGHYQELAPQLPGLEFMAATADLYLETIRRFGRFPHRNKILGRETTPEEQAFLDTVWNRKRGPENTAPDSGQ